MSKICPLTKETVLYTTCIECEDEAACRRGDFDETADNTSEKENPGEPPEEYISLQVYLKDNRCITFKVIQIWNTSLADKDFLGIEFIERKSKGYSTIGHGEELLSVDDIVSIITADITRFDDMWDELE